MKRHSGSNRTLAGAMAAGAGVATIAGRAFVRRRRTDTLRGQVVLITGGSRGLGLDLAKHFADHGCRLAICARDTETLERAQHALQEQGTEVFAMECDIADRTQVAAMIDRTIEQMGQIDILVNNAAIIQVGPLETLTIEDFEEAQGIIFWGMVYATLAVLPHMRSRRNGRIINICSIGGKISVPHLLPYSTAKAAATSFSEGLRAELAGTGITVTTVVPGLMRTGSYRHVTFTGEAQDEFSWFASSDTTPLIAMHPDEAARAIIGAALMGTAEITLSLPAKVGARFHGLFPGATADLLGLVNRFFLPSAPTNGSHRAEGVQLEVGVQNPLVQATMQSNRPDAEALNQMETPPEQARE